MVVVEVPGRSLAVGEGSWRLCKPRLRLGAAIVKAELEGVTVLYGVPLLLMVLRLGRELND
jgi:hypothetical protein